MSLIMSLKAKNKCYYTFPRTISHSVTPQLHQSTSKEYPGTLPRLDRNTSGAIYGLVPLNEIAIFPSGT